MEISMVSGKKQFSFRFSLDPIHDHLLLTENLRSSPPLVPMRHALHLFDRMAGLQKDSHESLHGGVLRTTEVGVAEKGFLDECDLGQLSNHWRDCPFKYL